MNVNATTTQQIVGGLGNDKLTLKADNTNVDLGAGNDELYGQGNSNYIDLGDGINTVDFKGNNNTIIGGAQKDSIKVTGNGNEINAGEGDNSVTVNGDSNIIESGSGNDRFTVNGNLNEVYGGDGENTTNINGNENSYVGGAGKDKVTIKGDTNSATGGDGNDEFNINSGANNAVDGEGGNNIINDAGEGTAADNAITATYSPFELKLKVGIGYDENSYLRASLDLGLLDFEIDLSSQATAWDAVKTIDEAIESIQSQMVQLGSLTNRLECILEEQTVRLNSMISTRSTIRDADIAEESSKLIRYQILQEAGATLLASSRKLRAENVLGLLQGLNKGYSIG